MKKSKRQEMILDIINNNHIETQEELVEALKKKDINVTQATVSRDIKELKLSKLMSQSGKYLYAGSAAAQQSVSEKLRKVFSEGYIKSDFSNNIVVMKTIVGMAPACALAIDAMQWPEIVGTLAGDDTIFVVTRSAEASEALIEKFNTTMKTTSR